MAKELDGERPGIDRRTILMAGGALAGGLALSAFAARPAAAAVSGFGGAADAALARTTALIDAPFHQQVVVWADDPNDADVAASHRIPGLLLLESSTILAVAEHRIGDGDGDKHTLVLKRSADQGLTWSAEQTVEPAPGSDSWVNPTLIQDRVSERVFLFYNGTASGVYGIYYRYSDDDGVTWSSRVNLTSLYAGNPYGWVSYGPGPGHGLQLASGRMLMQVWNRKLKSIEPPEARDYGLSLLSSDDGGLTWQLLSIVPVDRDYPAGETRIIERADGVLVWEARYAIGDGHSRITTASSDGGATWAPLELMPGIPPSPGVDVGYIRMTNGGTPRVLCTWLDHDTKKHNLTLSLSYDEGVTFPVSKLVNPGSSGYSDLLIREDGSILVLYEAGKGITLSILNLEWLTDGADSVATGPGIQRTVWQAESQTITSNKPSAVNTVADPLSINAERIEFAATAPGDYIEFPITVATAGTYELAARCVRRSNRGQFQLSVDGTPVGGVKDPRSSARIHPLYPAGPVTLTAGTHTVRVTVPGTTGPSHRLGLDYVQLIKQ